MAVLHGVDLRRPSGSTVRHGPPGGRPILPGLEANREGREEPLRIAHRAGLPGDRLKRVVDYVGDNLTSDLSVSQLAAIVGMSPHYFAELFRTSTGCTPHRYVLLQRIERAKQCLRESGCSITEVGLCVGFRNPSHFAHVFRQIVGSSPSLFRSLRMDQTE
jgi:AraC family transcriptional regulator